MVSGSDTIDRRGIHVAASAFEKLGFAFREQTTSDFGIDAQVEPRTGFSGTGGLLALQIKSGASYFRQQVKEGWWLRTDRKHAEYWLKHALAVLVVLVDVDEERVFWAAVRDRSIEFTETGAKILIRRDCRVDAHSLDNLIDYLSLRRDLGELVAEGSGCRIFFGRGISGHPAWTALACALIRQLDEIGCATGWDIAVEVRTGTEDDGLNDTNEYGAFAEDLASLAVDVNYRQATYSVSASQVARMHRESEAEATADAIIEHLMGADGLLVE